VIHPKEKLVTPEEYLAREAQAEYKSEYHNGEMYALAGGSVNHNQIVVNLTVSFSRLFERKPCRVFATDVRLHIKQSGLYTYPDVMVVCGKIEFVPGRDDTVMNPIVLVEAWSDSTQAYDRGEKFALYRQIPSLQEYVMIDQTQPYVEHFRREGNFWVLETLEQMDAILILPSLECEIPLAVMYEKVEWQEVSNGNENRS
jgi:Uma2 family endonuclease